MNKEMEKQIQHGDDVVEVETARLCTTARRAEVARLILANHPKAEIVQMLMDKYEQTYKWAYSEYRQGYVLIYLQSEATKEDLKKVNLAKLEELYERAEKEVEEERMSNKDYFNTQMKNIDLVNKTAGIYEADVNKVENNDINFQLNIGRKE